jgi:DUF4097 and DUF4098 domain-containing protein YvlB
MAEQPQPGTYMTPPAPPQPPPPRRRSLAGPIILIALGAIFLLWNLGHRTEIFRLFADYWPVLIIFWGLWKALDYMKAQREGRPASGIGVGGVLLLLLLIMFGSIASALRNWGPKICDGPIIIDGERIDLGFCGDPFEFTEEAEHPFQAGQKVRVVNEYGDIKVVAGAEGVLRLVANKTVYASDQLEANQKSEEIKPVVTVEGDTVSVDMSRTRKQRVDLVVHVPQNAGLDLMTVRGDLEITARRGDLKLHASNGGLMVEDITGNVNAHMRGGDARIVRVSGNVNLEGRGSEITIAEVGGTAYLTGDFFGAIRMERIAGVARFRSTRTDMEVGKLDGALMMEGGELRADRIGGPFSITTRSKDIELAEVAGNIRVVTSNGQVVVRPGVVPIGNIEVQNRRGDVELILPSQAGFELEARTRDGKIRSDFSEVNVNEERRESRASGKVGAGASKVSVETEDGSIEIRKAG